jgi:hypothetical protein
MPARPRDEKGRLMAATPPVAPDSEPKVAVTTQPRPGDNQPEDRHQTRFVSRDMPFLMDDDWLLVRNDDDKPVEFGWNRKRWVVMPGEEKAVIFQAIVNKLGDPRAVEDAIQHYDDGNGSRGQISKRHDYMIMLFSRYGIQEERVTDFTRDDGTVVVGLQSVVPKLSVTTMEHKLVQFPAYDPDMVPYPVHDAKKQRVNSDVTRMIESQQAENDELRVRLQDMEARMNRFMNAQQGTEAD